MSPPRGRCHRDVTLGMFHFMAQPIPTPAARRTRIVIIGGGFSGIGMAIRLRQAGIDDFVILERATEHGGTWRDNSYPGCACDVQSALYSYSFAPNPDWSHRYARQAEIWSYLRRCATQYDIDRHFVFSQDVTGTVWDNGMQRWTVTTGTHSWNASFVVLATGALSDPVIPAIRGLETFAGRMFHSAQWDHDLDLTAKRVAVIGTGASAIQFIPQIQPRVAQLDVYQRTPGWVLPRRDHAIAPWRKALYRAVPLTQRIARATIYAQREALHLPFRHRGAARVLERFARWSMHRQITDRTMRVQLAPQYQLGCKRILVTDDYYPALRQSNVALITDAIMQVEVGGIVTADGVHHAADVIILGTGFRPTDPPLAPVIVGRAGMSLADAWRGSPQAYMGTTQAGFPNFFQLLGPNTGLGHNSIVLMIEAQIEHVLDVLAVMASRGAGAAEPSDVAQRRFVADVDARLATTTWNAGGCRSWYLDRTGRNSTIWPDGVGRFVRTVTRVVAADYRFEPRHAGVPVSEVHA